MYIIVVPRYTFPDKIGSFFTLVFMHSGRFSIISSKNYKVLLPRGINYINLFVICDPSISKGGSI